MEIRSMKEENKFIKAIAKLIELTQDGTLKWTVSRETKELTKGTDNVIDLAYLAQEEVRQLRLYELKYKDYLDEFNFNWGNQPVLEIVDDLGHAAWTFPHNRALADLLEAVRYQTSGVDEFIDRLLSKPGPAL
jgi:hypothetical protein